MTGCAALSTVQRLWLVAICAGAVGLRWHDIGQLSLVHFDEGVLVSGAFGVWLKGFWNFPLAQPLQAPPLFPWMVAATFGITGTPWPIMGIYLSAALGAATVVIYFALLRRLYGGTIGLVGAALLATSDLHVSFSRMALTDVALTFWFVTAGDFLVRLVTVDGERQFSGGARVRRYVLWGLLFGLATGAAWNTKYNGWMIVAMAATTWMVVAARQRLLPISSNGCPENSLPGGILLTIGLSAVVAIGCFTPWYLYVERTYPGGYGAVTENHLRYVGGILDWPSRAGRLWLSLAAFRHFGCLTIVTASAVALCFWVARCCRAREQRPMPSRTIVLATALMGLAGLAAAVAMGSDAVILVLATTAILPALVWGRWPEVFFAVWMGAFVVLTPFYHPYTRLLVPILPAAIALTMWSLSNALGANCVAAFQAVSGNRRPGMPPHGGTGAAERRFRDRLLAVPSPKASQTIRLMLALSCLGVFLAAASFHPFGWLPSRPIWNRWSTRQSYRALGDAVLAADLPSDAMVLCQGPPAMALYIERPWTPLEIVPFDLWLSRFDRHRECYLAVDFWGAYGENHQLALRAIHQRLDCLQPIAVVPNDLNIPTLLDYLPPASAAHHLSRQWPLKQIADTHGREVAMPADLDEPFASVIVLYRIDRDCLPEILDKTHHRALK